MEIKFRVWSHKDKKFWFHGEGRSLHYFVTSSREIDCDLLDVTMQIYTGLKDCDGKEIYQGDLVKAEKSNAYLKGVYEVIWDAKRGRWAYKGNSYQVGKSGNLKCRVVGNIFESKL